MRLYHGVHPSASRIEHHPLSPHPAPAGQSPVEPPVSCPQIHFYTIACFLKEILTISLSFQWFTSVIIIKFKLSTVYKHDLVPNDHPSRITPTLPAPPSPPLYCTEPPAVSRRHEVLLLYSSCLRALSQPSSPGQFLLTFRFQLEYLLRTVLPWLLETGPGLPFHCVHPGPMSVSTQRLHGIGNAWFSPQLNSKQLEGKDQFLASVKSLVPTQCLWHNCPPVNQWTSSFEQK